MEFPMRKRAFRNGILASALLLTGVAIGTTAGAQAWSDAAATHALALAEQGGGKVMQMRTQAGAAGPLYEAWVVKNGIVQQETIDPQTGTVTMNGTGTPVANLDMSERRAAHNIGEARLSMADAMMTAQKLADGPVTGAEFITSRSGSILAYQLEMQNNTGNSNRVMIDAKSGNVIVTPDLVTSG
jgi:hypothetical protein